MDDKLEIKLLSDNARLPTRANTTDAGFDIYSAETCFIEPQEKVLIATDIAVNIPEGYVGLLTSRSGVSSKTELVIETGKIDAGFHGNMKINVKNDTQDSSDFDRTCIYYKDIKEEIKMDRDDRFYPESYKVNCGDKLAQLVIIPIWTPELKQVEDFSNETARGEKGFGSSGY